MGERVHFQGVCLRHHLRRALGRAPKKCVPGLAREGLFSGSVPQAPSKDGPRQVSQKECARASPWLTPKNASHAPHFLHVQTMAHLVIMHCLPQSPHIPHVPHMPHMS